MSPASARHDNRSHRSHRVGSAGLAAYGVQLAVHASAAELMQSAQVRSGPLHVSGCPLHETIGQAHQVFQALSQGDESSLLPQAESASATKHANGSSDR